ncbi:MAG TPA: DUF4126 domain-containing protein [Candidatus Eisenbacteria bacterium]|nr:DUF4126 domain-containing protein [Candidatus Eisenbacteria bacterium]
MSLHLIGLALGASFAAGLNLYATVATLGLLQRLGVVTLPAPLQPLAHPVVIGVALFLYVIEFFADKIPYVDTAWDTLHTFIRPPAAAILAYAAVAGVPEPWRIVAALVAGGVALTSHGTKTTTRAAVNTSPEPISNWILSVAEDEVAISLTWLAVAHPVLTLGIVTALLAISIWILMRVLRYFRRLFRSTAARKRQTVP